MRSPGEHEMTVLTLADAKSERNTREYEIRAVYPVSGAAQISVGEGALAGEGR